MICCYGNHLLLSQLQVSLGLIVLMDLGQQVIYYQSLETSLLCVNPRLSMVNTCKQTFWLFLSFNDIPISIHLRITSVYIIFNFLLDCILESSSSSDEDENVPLNLQKSKKRSRASNNHSNIALTLHFGHCRIGFCSKIQVIQKQNNPYILRV